MSTNKFLTEDQVSNLKESENLFIELMEKALAKESSEFKFLSSLEQ